MKCAILTLHGKIHLISREIPLAFEEGGEAEREGYWLLHFLINFSDDAFWMLNTFEDLNMPTHTDEHICIQLPLKHFLQFESVVAATFRLVLRQTDTGQLAEICCFKSLCWFCSKWFCKTTKALCIGAVIGISNKEEGTQIHNPLKK